MDEEYLYEEPKSEGRGRTAKKREAKAVERLAEKLMALKETELTDLPLGDELRSELMAARNTKGHGSRKRSMKHFAGLLRRDEAARELLQEALDQVDEQHGQEAAAHHDLEQLRERLCSEKEGPAALKEVASRYPALDLKGLQRLIKAVRHGNDKKAYREIFRRLRDVL